MLTKKIDVKFFQYVCDFHFHQIFIFFRKNLVFIILTSMPIFSLISMFLFKNENIFPTVVLQPDRVVEEIEFVLYFLCLFSYFGGLTILGKTLIFQGFGLG
jgi:hypothetical protein